MSVVAITSSRTSPGVTSLATGLAMVWSHRFDRALYVEADPSGGVQSLRFDLEASPSLTTFGSDVRNGFSAEALWANTQDLRGVEVLTAPVDPRLAGAWIERVTPAMCEHLPRLGVPVVIDLGQLYENSPALPLSGAADTTLIVTRPEIAEIQALLFQVSRLKAAGANVALVTIGSTPNDPAEIAHLAGIPLAAVLPDDRVIAAGLTGAKVASQKVRRSLLWRTIGGLADSLVDQVLMNERREDVIYLGSDVVDLTGDSMIGQHFDGQPIAAAVASPPPPTAADAVFPSAAPVAPITPAAPVEPVGSFTEPPAPAAPAPTAAPQPAPIAPAPAAPAPLAPPLAPHPVAPAAVEVTVGTGPMHNARLVGADGSEHPLVGGQSFVLGRHRTCDIIVNDAEASRRHGCVSSGELGWRYRDLESSNGTRCNGHRISDVLLTPGDELRIGKTVLRFELVASLPPTSLPIRTF